MNRLSLWAWLGAAALAVAVAFVGAVGLHAEPPTWLAGVLFLPFFGAMYVSAAGAFVGYRRWREGRPADGWLWVAATHAVAFLILFAAFFIGFAATSGSQGRA